MVSSIRVTGSSTVRTAEPIVFPGKEDPVTGEVTFTIPRRTAPFLVTTLPPINPTSESVPEAAASDVAAAAAAAAGYSLSDIAAGAGAPSIGALETSTDLTTTPAATDNTYLYIGLAAAAVGGLYLFSQTDAGKRAFAKPR